MNANSDDCWCVYLLLCSDGSFYTGVTTDLKRRIRQHNGEIVGGANYTRSRRPVALAWFEACENRSVAQQREYVLRRSPRLAKQRLAAIAITMRDD